MHHGTILTPCSDTCKVSLHIVIHHALIDVSSIVSRYCPLHLVDIKSPYDCLGFWCHFAITSSVYQTLSHHVVADVSDIASRHRTPYLMTHHLQTSQVIYYCYIEAWF